METLFQDIRHSFRAIARNPAFAFLVVFMLAIGIGANTAIFSFVNGVLLRPLPFPDSDRLITLSERNPEKSQRLTSVSPRNLEDWETRSQTIEAFGAWRDWRFKLTTPQGPTLVSSAIASPGLFTVLGIKPTLGRTFVAEENQPGHDRVVVITHSYWQSHFGGDTQIVGQEMLLDNESFTIVGVLPREFESLDFGWFKVWAPLSVDEDQFLDRHLRNRRVYARLRSGVSISEARSEMETIARQLADEYPQDNAGWTVSISSLQDQEVGAIRPALLIFLGAVGLVLIIACANIANLLLARAAGRRKEFAIRASLGAGRMRIVRQLLTESIALALAGGVAGILLASWLMDLFAAISPNIIPRLNEVKIDGSVLAFTVTLSILTGILFGLAPALQSSRINLVEELKEGQRSFFKGSGVRLRGLLVVSQLALALVLLIGAGLLTQSFARMIALRPGFNPENLLTVQLFLPLDKYKERSQVVAFYQRVTGEFKSIPGVERVGATSAGPQFGGYEPVEFLIEGQAAPPSGEYPQARYYNAGPDYFHTMEIPVLKGREFTDRDSAGATPVAIINETMARRFWPDENPVGKRLALVREKETVEIVGVVGDVKRFGLSEQPEMEIYWPYMQKPRWASYFVFRASGDPSSIASGARSAVLSAGPDVVVTNVSTMDQLISSSLRRPRFNMLLIAMFAITALLLAVTGIYGVVSYSVARRTREIGIRLALGADGRDILRLVMGQGLVLTLAGLGAGIAAAMALTRFLSNLIYGVSETDAMTFALISASLGAVALIACYIPARRAMRVDPVAALRHE
ncbi:MAG: ABC transporter permease [Acidobacteriota bacterium]